MRPLRLRRAITLGVLALLVGATASMVSVACGSPYAEESTGNPGDAGSSDASVLDTGADTRDPGPVSLDAAGPPDAPVIGDAGMKVDASGCTVCDCDGDGFANVGCTDAGGALDCDDTDSRTHPGQMYLADPPEPPRNGDWNCEKGVEKLYATNVNCTALAPGATCDNTLGFTSDPACGSKATFVQCASNLGIKCVVQAQTMNFTQACR